MLLAFNSAAKASSNQQRLVDVRQIQLALKDYFRENGLYPYGNGVPNGIATYLEHWPTPPKPNGVCPATPNAYSYNQKYAGDDYVVSFCLGIKTAGLKAGMHLLTSKGVQ